MKLLEDYFKEYQITVLNPDRSSEPIYPRADSDLLHYKKFIYILYHNGHFSLITKPNRFFNARGYCDFCKKPFNHDHICIKACKRCKHIDCQKTNPIKCEKCKSECNNSFCLQKHIEQYCYKRSKKFIQTVRST